MKTLPAVVAFVCNWEGYRGLETAAQKGLTIPASVKIVRVSCLSRVHSGLLLKAFELGAGGVILVGCSDHHCHYGTEKSVVDLNLDKVRSIMSLLGLQKEQLELCRISQSDGSDLVSKLIGFNQQVSALVTASVYLEGRD
jgi:coenzyme F420-reducing hydrogenase delta subunit